MAREVSSVEAGTREACAVVCSHNEKLRSLVARVNHIVSELHGPSPAKAENATTKDPRACGSMREMHNHLAMTNGLIDELAEALKRL